MMTFSTQCLTLKWDRLMPYCYCITQGELLQTRKNRSVPDASIIFSVWDPLETDCDKELSANCFIRKCCKLGEWGVRYIREGSDTVCSIIQITMWATDTWSQRETV